MYFPHLRLRRLRKNENIRRMIGETKLSVDDLVYPMFVEEGKGVKAEVKSMPGVYRFSTDTICDEAKKVYDLEIPAIILFGIPEKKDEVASEAYSETGIIQKTVKKLKEKVPDLLVITDVCLCEYMEHGHCGIIKDGDVDNDLSLELLAQTAVSHAEAGADIIAPSDMMDGRISVIRQNLDQNGFKDTPIMSYAAKYSSSFYGPFRDAAESAPKFGDRRTYQMNPPNVLEAIREVSLDIDEGADIVMVKPALSYLDVISKVKETFGYPTAAYNVSGEYSLVKAAASKGYIDEERMVLEILTSIKRAGADIILTYHALDVAGWIK